MRLAARVQRPQALENRRVAREACRQALLDGCAPFAPHLLYPQFLDDEDPEARERGISAGVAFLETCAELWAFGEPTEGMRTEIATAHRLGIAVKFKSLEGEDLQGAGLEESA